MLNFETKVMSTEHSLFFHELEKEVESLADSMSVEIILLLVDKWEAEIRQKIIMGEFSTKDALHHYIRLKMSLHHLIRRWEREGDFGCDVSEISISIRNLTLKTKEARKNYYVTKRRHENEHRDNCTCRGCRCIKSI